MIEISKLKRFLGMLHRRGLLFIIINMLGVILELVSELRLTLSQMILQNKQKS